MFGSWVFQGQSITVFTPRRSRDMMICPEPQTPNLKNVNSDIKRKFCTFRNVTIVQVKLRIYKISDGYERSYVNSEYFTSLCGRMSL